MFKKLIKKLKFKEKNKKYRKSIFIEEKEKKYFKKRKKIKQLKLNNIRIDRKKLSMFYILIAIIIPIIIVLLIISPIFSIKKVNIVKKDNITDINIAYKSIEDIRWKPIFLPIYHVRHPTTSIFYSSNPPHNANSK